jgi:ATP-dependent DNA ligase
MASYRKVIGEIAEGILAIREGVDLFIEVDGVMIARRGHPGTPQEGTWVSIEPGWQVVDGSDFKSIAIVRLITRNGYNWTSRFPWIGEVALKNRIRQFVIDGEAVILGVDGISDFKVLHSRRHNDEVQLCAFDVLAMDGDDLRRLPLSMRKANLERLLARRPEGIFLSPFEQGEIGPDLFRKACEFGLEGLVSKHRDRPYQSGRSKHWIKVKNRKHHAFDRVQEAHRR